MCNSWMEYKKCIEKSIQEKKLWICFYLEKFEMVFDGKQI